MRRIGNWLRYCVRGTIVLAVPFLAGCYLWSDATEGWTERRIQRDDGEMVARLKQDGDRYRVVLQWPTEPFGLPRDIDHATREAEARAFVESLCGEERTPYLYNQVSNRRTPEVYYDFWCRPKARNQGRPARPR